MTKTDKDTGSVASCARVQRPAAGSYAEEIGCIVMASGLSARYGKNKLLEKLGDREVILHTVSAAAAAGLSPVTVTRSEEVKRLLDEKGYPCILHEMPLKSDTMHIGMKHAGVSPKGWLFMQGDQPLILPETISRLVRDFLNDPESVCRLSYCGSPGSPVIFPASMKEELLSYRGDRGGMEILKKSGTICRTTEASGEWELMDADTPESMEKLRQMY